VVIEKSGDRGLYFDADGGGNFCELLS